MEESIVHHPLFHLSGTLLYEFFTSLIFFYFLIHLFSLCFSFSSSSPPQASFLLTLIVFTYFFHQVSPFYLASYVFCSPSSLSSIFFAVNPKQ